MNRSQPRLRKRNALTRLAVFVPMIAALPLAGPRPAFSSVQAHLKTQKKLPAPIQITPVGAAWKSGRGTLYLHADVSGTSGVYLYCAYNEQASRKASSTNPNPQDAYDVVFQEIKQQSANALTHKPFLLRLTSTIGKFPTETLLSPDGRYLFLRLSDGADLFGSPDSLVIYDLRKQAITRIYEPKEVRYRHAEWSPNSQYVAFVVGARVDGSVLFTPDFQIGDDPHIGVLDVGTGQVQTSPDAVFSLRFSWTSRNSLLYISDNKLYEWSLENPKTKVARLLTGNIYSEVRSLPDDAPQAICSPDGRSIAYFGLLPKENAKSKAADLDAGDAPPGLYLYHYTTHSAERIANLTSGFLTWSSDSRRVYNTVLTDLPVEGGPKPHSRITATIRAVDIASRSTTEVASIGVDDAEELHRYAGPVAPFKVLSIPNPNEMLIEGTASGEQDSRGFFDQSYILFSVDLRSKKITQVSTVIDEMSSCWFSGALTK